MAKYTDADCRLCRREGCKLFLKGDRCLTAKCAMEKRPQAPGQHGLANARKKQTEYGVQLREKQRIKRFYGLLEKQFFNTYEKANQAKGNTGDNLLSLLERRLDNVTYRMGIGASRAQARQIVNHGHILVNGKSVNIPSYSVKMNDVITIKENKQKIEMFKELSNMKISTPKWIEFDAKKLTGKIIALPVREDIDMTFKEHLVVELYSR